MRQSLYFLLLLVIFSQLPAPDALADQIPGDKNPSVSENSKHGYARLDRQNSRHSAVMPTESEQNVMRKILWYIPNRVIDLIDVFRLDVGAGPAAGVVVRATRYGQVGARGIYPLAGRIGLRGRRVPVFLERDEEYGIGPHFHQSRQRQVTPYEIGVGIDLGVGAYAGISLDELADFFAGFVFIDLSNDDLAS